ncbi:hypothetical protein N2152v2_007454 [Parachlorella kessleri]
MAALETAQQLVMALERLGRQCGDGFMEPQPDCAPDWTIDPDAAIAHFCGQAQQQQQQQQHHQRQSGPAGPHSHCEVLALTCLGPRPDACEREEDATPQQPGSPEQQLVRLVSIPLPCSHAQLQQILARGVTHPRHVAAMVAAAAADGPMPQLRITYCLPPLAALVDVCDDADVQRMWEQVVQHTGAGRLQIYWDWRVPRQQECHASGGVEPEQLAARLQTLLGPQLASHQGVATSAGWPRHHSPGLGGGSGGLTSGSGGSAGSVFLADGEEACTSTRGAALEEVPAAPRARASKAGRGPRLSPVSTGKVVLAPTVVPASQGSRVLTSFAGELLVIPPTDLTLRALLPSRAALVGHLFQGQWQGRNVAVRCLHWPLLAGQHHGFAAAAADSQQALLTSLGPAAALKHANLVEVLGVVLADPTEGCPAGGYSTGNSLWAQGLHHPTPLQRAAASLARAPALLTAWVAGGSLRDALERRDHPLLHSAPARLHLLRQVADGMRHLHGHGITHFRLTPASILLGGEDRMAARVAGYELPAAKLRLLLSREVAFAPQILPWLAPEIHKGTAPITDKASMQAAGVAALGTWALTAASLSSSAASGCAPRYRTLQVDVYAFGILMWELWARRPPYDCLRLQVLADSMRGSGVVMRPIIPCKHALPQPVPGWRCLMERCWAEDPQARPCFADIARELRAMAHQ